MEIKRVLLQNSQNKNEYEVRINRKEKAFIVIKLSLPNQEAKSFEVQIINWEPLKQIISLKIKQKIHKARLFFDKKHRSISVNLINSQNTENFVVKILNHHLKKKRYLSESKHPKIPASILYSPIAGKILKCHVRSNQRVQKNQRLLVIESMKMENEILAEANAFIKTIPISEGDLVQTNQVLIKFEEINTKNIEP